MKFRNIIDRFLSISSVLLLAIMVAAVTYQVIMRYIFNAPSSIVESIILVSFMWMILLGGTYTAGQNKHISIDLLKDKVSPPKQRMLAYLSILMMINFACLFLIYGGYNMISTAYGKQQIHSGLQIHMHYILAVLPIAGLCMLYYGIDDLRQLNKNKGGES
ncbi:MAG: TRAP transporter small permease [Alphaproteobacteria bacterium]